MVSVAANRSCKRPTAAPCTWLRSWTWRRNERRPKCLSRILRQFATTMRARCCQPNRRTRRCGLVRERWFWGLRSRGASKRRNHVAEESTMKSRLLDDRAEKTYVLVFDAGDEVVSGLTDFAKREK